MPAEKARQPEELTEDEREELRRAHIRLRKTSQDLEALLATPKMRGRWDPAPVPAEAMDGARDELVKAYAKMWLLQRELLGWDLPGGVES
ncbi:MAG: hypothetical protein ABIS21_05380 [Acidimicrobiales bacterium]